MIASYITTTSFDYAKLCSNDGGALVSIDWCTMEAKGEEWHYASWIRIGIACFLVLLFIVMSSRAYHATPKNENKNLDTYLQIKKRFFSTNACLVYLYELILMAWAVLAAVSVIAWNVDNPIYHFDSVGWSITLIFVCAQIFVIAVLFFALVFDHCRSK